MANRPPTYITFSSAEWNPYISGIIGDMQLSKLAIHLNTCTTFLSFYFWIILSENYYIHMYTHKHASFEILFIPTTNKINCLYHLSRCGKATWCQVMHKNHRPFFKPNLRFWFSSSTASMVMYFTSWTTKYSGHGKQQKLLLI